MFHWMLLKPAHLLSLWVHCLSSYAGAGKAGKFPVSPGLYAISCALLSRSVVSSPLQPYGLQPARLLCPWDSPGKNTGVGCHALLQGIFPTQGLNPDLPHCKWILYCLSHQGSPRILEWVAYPFSKGSSRPRNRTGISCTAGRFFTSYHGIAIEEGIKAEEKGRDPEARPPPNLPSATGHTVLNTYTQTGSQLFSCRPRGTDTRLQPHTASKVP